MQQERTAIPNVILCINQLLNDGSVVYLLLVRGVYLRNTMGKFGSEHVSD